MSDERGRKAFEILVRENSRMLLSYLHSVVVDRAAVDDLFQETMVVAWKRLDECDLSRPFGPWLRGIASRLVMAFHRKRKTTPLILNETVLAHIEGHFAAIASKEENCWDDKVSALRDCLESLPDSQRSAIDYRYFDELTGNKLAERLGISLEGCWKRLARGRRMLADCLARKGVLMDPEAAS